MKFQIVYVVLTLLWSVSAWSQPSASFEALAQRIERLKLETKLPSGTAIAVVQNGEIRYQGYFGYADIEQRRRVTDDTAFYIASATKPVFALSVLLQTPLGKLTTNTPLKQLCPDLSFSAIDAGAITVSDLLTHTSGIENSALVWASAFTGEHNAELRVNLAAESQINQKRGHGQFQYTNVGYNVLSVCLEQSRNKSWQHLVQQSVLEPLGMEHSSPYLSEALAKDWPLAKPYSLLSGKPTQPLFLEKTDQTMHAAGGLIASAPDLARLLIAEMEQGKLKSEAVFPSDIVSASQQRVANTDAKYLDFHRDGYAWGWYTGDYKGERMLHHFGAFAGFHAHLSFMPEKRIGLVVLNNEDVLSAHLTNLIADYVYELLLNDAAPVDTETKFDRLRANAEKMTERVVMEHQKIRERPFKLSLARDAYAGHYVHPLLGTLRVTLVGDNVLQVNWGRLSATATGFDQENTVRLELIPNAGELLAFELTGGQVVAAKLDGMVFHKSSTKH